MYRRSLFAGLLIAGAFGPALAAPASGSPMAQVAGDCAQVSASVRTQAYGYQHVVTLRNHCQRPVMCEVWTDVDPLPHVQLVAQPGEAAEVATRVGSPSREVHAQKSCRFVSGG